MADIDKLAKEFQANFEQIVYQFQTAESETIESIENLSSNEMKAITFIGKQGECIMREISGFLRVADSTVTMLIDNLVKKDLVMRERTDEDRRIIKILLTDSGDAIYKTHLDAYNRFCRGMLMALNDEERKTYVALLKKISEGVKDQFASA